MLKVLDRVKWRILSRCMVTKKEAKKKVIPEVNIALKDYHPEGITMVRTKDMARKVIQILYENKSKVCAWDTESIGIDVKEESPVGKGQVICASAFCGPEVDFGSGPSTLFISSLGLFIDNYADAQGIINEFKDYLEDPNIHKCWQNYSFDRHVLYNHGIDTK